MKSRSSKMILRIIIKVWFLVCLIITINGCDQALQVAKVPQVAVEDLRIDKIASNAWGLVGKIRNLEKRPIKGYVKIKFLDSKGDILHSYKAFVNDNDPLQPGQAGPFKYYTKPEDFNGVKNFNVIFVER